MRYTVHLCVSGIVDLKLMSLFLVFLIRLCGFFLFKFGQDSMIYILEASPKCFLKSNAVASIFLSEQLADHYLGGFPPVM